MDLLAKLERALEGMYEGVFSRAFKAPLQPVEVARRLTREMENHRTVSVSATYVPNVYTVYLAPESYQEFLAISGRLNQELEQYLRESIAEHHYQTVGTVEVHLAEDARLHGQELTIVAINVENAPSTSPPPQAAAVPNSPTPTANVVTELEFTAGEYQGKRIALHTNLTIGRGISNAIALSEPDVSRQHAEFVKRGDLWEVHDLGSTNGTFLNDHRITVHPLAPGDIVQIGHTVIRVH